MDKNATTPRPPVSVMIGRQLDQEKIDVLSKRVETLISSNTTLRTSAERNEKDTHDIVLYFQRELEMKDDIIGRLNEELIKKDGQVRAEGDRLKEKYETEIFELKRDYEDRIDTLSSRLEKCENELSNLDSYKRDKDSHDRKLSDVQNALKEEKAKGAAQLEDQERKFLESKVQGLKELEDQKLLYRENALRDAREAMNSEAKKLVVENKRITEELKFHNMISYEFQMEKDKLEADLVIAKREVALLSEKEEEYAKQNFLKTKEIKVLRERVEQLEKAQVVSVEKYRARTKELQGTISKDLEDATLDAAGLRRLISIKNKELRHMKALAATILEQRSEMEHFFLESLSEVKRNISNQRQRSSAENVQEYNQKRAQSIRQWTKKGQAGKARTGTFPSIKGNRMHYLEETDRGQTLPSSENQKVFIQDLSWDDKELVLRLLFAKMNGTHKAVDSAIQGTTSKKKRHTQGGGGRDSPVFISEGKGLDDGELVGVNDSMQSSYAEHFTLPGFTEEVTAPNHTNFAIPYDELTSSPAPPQDRSRPMTDEGYEFGDGEGCRVNLA